MSRPSFENLDVYKLSEKIADIIWEIVKNWPNLARDTVGKQIVRSADSIGANIAEGNGRWNFRDNCRFVKIARGSLYETQHWLRRAFFRQLLTQIQIDAMKPILDELSPRLNAYLNSIINRKPENGNH